MKKVSVIVPVYGVERFVGKCAESLLTQTLKDIEVLFVDDATKDGSVAVIESCISSHPEFEGSVRILHHDVNKGLPAARNTGLEQATGEFVFHCDGDDWMEPDALELMYGAAQKKDADIVYCDFFMTFEKNERYMRNPDYTDGQEYLRDGLLRGKTKYNVWNKLVRRSLYDDNGILFPDGHSMGEDMTMVMLSACADKVAHVSKGLYHYVKMNESAYTSTFSDRHLEDIRFNADRLFDFLDGKFGDELREDISIFKLNLKLPFLITDDDRMYELWAEWYPEANEYISERNVWPWRTRMVQRFAKKGMFCFVKLYYLIVFRTIYGLIYR